MTVISVGAQTFSIGREVIQALSPQPESPMGVKSIDEQTKQAQAILKSEELSDAQKAGLLKNLVLEMQNHYYSDLPQEWEGRQVLEEQTAALFADENALDEFIGKLVAVKTPEDARNFHNEVLDQMVQDGDLNPDTAQALKERSTAYLEEGLQGDQDPHQLALDWFGILAASMGAGGYLLSKKFWELQEVR